MVRDGVILSCLFILFFFQMCVDVICWIATQIAFVIRGALHASMVSCCVVRSYLLKALLGLSVASSNGRGHSYSMPFLQGFICLRSLWIVHSNRSISAWSCQGGQYPPCNIFRTARFPQDIHVQGLSFGSFIEGLVWNRKARQNLLSVHFP